MPCPVSYPLHNREKCGGRLHQRLSKMQRLMCVLWDLIRRQRGCFYSECSLDWAALPPTEGRTYALISMHYLWTPGWKQASFNRMHKNIILTWRKWPQHRACEGEHWVQPNSGLGGSKRAAGKGSTTERTSAGSPKHRASWELRERGGLGHPSPLIRFGPLRTSLLLLHTVQTWRRWSSTNRVEWRKEKLNHNPFTPLSVYAHLRQSQGENWEML